MTTSRGYCITLNNYTTEEYDALLAFTKYDYKIIGKEIGEEGTPHLQAYIYKKSKISFAGLKKIVPRGHIEKSGGSPEQNKVYCSKDGNYIEQGECPKQGKRTDLNEIKDLVLEDKITVDEILEADPIVYHQYGRTLEKIEDLRNRKKFRTEMTTCTWYHGQTESGKSHRAYEGFNPSTHYNWKSDGGWWDGYKGQHTVIINELREEIPYGELLKLIDKWPHEVRRRNREPIPFVSKHIIITSALKPDEIYTKLKVQDSLDQLYRRITLVDTSFVGSEADCGIIDDVAGGERNECDGGGAASPLV